MSSQLLDVPHKHPSSIWSFADNALTLLRETVLTAGYVPLTTLAEKAVTSVLRNITIGHLRIITSERVYEFPARGTEAGEDVEPRAELRVLNDAFWVRLCTMGDLGFAEAYMFGDVACEDLISTFRVFLKNKENMTSLNSTVSWLFSLPQRLTSYRFLNSLGNARSNISAHYDLSDDMFKAFLSEDMTYSCAIFSDLDGDLRETPLFGLNGHEIRQLLTSSSPSESTSAYSDTPASHTPSTRPTPPLADTLAAAQQRKLAHIVSRARILPGHRVLEIGSGWGSLALHIVRHVAGVQVDTITLSDNQCAHVRAEVARCGFEDRVRVHLLDYREMPREWDGSFDRVVSVEMVEAVGLENVEVYWTAIDRVLKKNGAGVIQGITIPEARFAEYSKQMDFIQKWVSKAFAISSLFPGGALPTITLLVNSLARATSGRLVVDSISNIGPHYARTLREWRRRFEDNFAEIERALRKDHPDAFDSERGAQRARDELAVFRRKWLFFLSVAEDWFLRSWRDRQIIYHIITFTREGNEEMGCDVFE
ncbi:S-adenosyl-L-methionine-dependent methyltransferase [Lactifluus subvellereus]|nr:S-adenosyl-L-methionine-dependent methyltransferase [Lactifluus subvellereus]